MQLISVYYSHIFLMLSFFMKVLTPPQGFPYPTSLSSIKPLLKLQFFWKIFIYIGLKEQKHQGKKRNQ